MICSKHLHWLSSAPRRPHSLAKHRGASDLGLHTPHTPRKHCGLQLWPRQVLQPLSLCHHCSLCPSLGSFPLHQPSTPQETTEFELLAGLSVDLCLASSSGAPQQPVCLSWLSALSCSYPIKGKPIWAGTKACSSLPPQLLALCLTPHSP